MLKCAFGTIPFFILSELHHLTPKKERSQHFRISLCPFSWKQTQQCSSLDRDKAALQCLCCQINMLDVSGKYDVNGVKQARHSDETKILAEKNR